MSTLFFIIGGVVLLLFVFLCALMRAPRGYQDAQGFHFYADRGDIKLLLQGGAVADRRAVNHQRGNLE